MPKTRGESGATYDPADFLIPAQDHQGHSERIWARVQPLHDRDVDVILRSKNFPFRTKGDIMRWCLVTGIKRLHTMEPVMQSFLQQAEAINEMLRDEMYMQEYHGIFDTLQKVVGQHVTMGQPGEAVRLVAQIKHKLESIEGEPNWRKKCLATLNERFGHYLNQKPIGLHTTHTDESGD